MLKNESGNFRINLMDEFRKASRQAMMGSGWTKRITGIDKSKSNGFSLLGDFVKAADKLNEREPGCYLVCTWESYPGGPTRVYRLFYLWPESGMQFITMVTHSPEWAMKLWPEIERSINSKALTIALDRMEAKLDPMIAAPVDAKYEDGKKLHPHWTEEELQHEIAVCQTELHRRRAGVVFVPISDYLIAPGTEDEDSYVSLFDQDLSDVEVPDELPEPIDQSEIDSYDAEAERMSWNA